jgi:YidC/Oxa1 family membrane protein insertase
MDRKSATGFILIAVILVIWMTIRSNDAEREAAIAKIRQDSIARVDAQQRANDAIAKRKQDSITKLIVSKDTLINKDSILRVKNLQEFGAFGSSQKGDNTPIIIQNEKIRATIYPFGGRIGEVELKGIKTWDNKPLLLFTPDSTHFGIAFFDKQRVYRHTDSLYFKPQGTSFSVDGANSKSIALRLYTDSIKDNQYIEYLYSLTGNSNTVDCKISFVGFDKIFQQDQSYVNLNWSMNPPSQEKNLKNERMIESVFYNFDGDETVGNLKESGDDKKPVTGEPFIGELKWVSFKQQYFSSIIIAKTKFASGAEMSIRTPSDPRAVKAMSATLPIPIGGKSLETFPISFYFGSNKFSDLKAYNLHFERQINLGWGLFGWLNRVIFVPLFSWLGGSVVNYGIAILLLTIIVKIVLFPVAYKSFLSSAKMRVMKPEIDEINAKFAKDDILKKQQATSALYKSAGINPAAGCIPLLLQIPILFSLIRLFPAAFELRQAHFLWANDLSTYDSVLNFGFSIPWYGDHVSMFALLMTISTLLYTWMNQQMLSPGSTQLPGMKWLIYLMPAMFLGFLNSYSAALSYYYFVSNIITFGQMWLMRRYVDHDAIRAKIDENKKKPVKTSGFMQRLEQAQRKRLEDMKQQQGNKGGGNNKKKK